MRYEENISGRTSWSGNFELPLLDYGYGDETKELYVQLRDASGENVIV